MTLSIFSVHDSKAEAFITPFFAQNEAVGVRMFAAAANSDTSDFNRFAGDYTLFLLGYFEQDNAEFDLLDTPKNLGLAITHIHTPMEGTKF